MKPRCSNQRNQALTITEVLVVIVLLIVLASFVLPWIAASKRPYQPINCVNNLKQIGLAFRIWEVDNGDKSPIEVSAANGGAKELALTGDVAGIFRVMSNEVDTPKILICPADTSKIVAANFTTDFNNSKISYFVGLDATNKDSSQVFLSGDDNFAIGGITVKSGVLALATNTSIAWASGRHISYNSHFWTSAQYKYVGNIGLDDGSVESLTVQGLQQAFQNTGVATNRLAIP